MFVNYRALVCCWICLLFAVLTIACQDDVSKTTRDGQNNTRIDPQNNGPNNTANNNNNNNSSDLDSGMRPDAGTQDSDGFVIPDVGNCQPNDAVACVSQTSQLACKADGSGFEERQCPAGEFCLLGQCGDQICIPGEQLCADAESTHQCNADGTGFENVVACTGDTVCQNNSCQTICDLGGKGPSYIGCEYWTIDLDQYPDPTSNPSADEIPHALVISNPGDQPAVLTFQTRAQGVTLNFPDPVVPPGEARAFTMPRLDVDGTGITQNAIHVRSSFPVIAHQFNPLNNDRVYSNDASLLLPVSALGTEYLVMNWPTQILPCIPNLPCFPPQHSYVTVIATSHGVTNLLVNSTATIASGGGINSFPAGVPRSFTLNFGDVLNLEARGPLGSSLNDLTGTLVRSDQPIAVFAGHEQAVIAPTSGMDSCCADHLEQQLFPLSTWGDRYIATFSPGRGEKVDHWRILAGEDNVTVTTNPPQPGANNVVLNKGQFVKFESNQSFEVQATGKVLVGQFLVGQDQTSAVTGDPAFVLAVPVVRFREDYHLLTPTGYTHNFVSVIRPAGATIRLDGVDISDQEFSPVGTGDFEVASISVQAGVHVLTSRDEEEFGIIAYGFDRAVSYGYPGGLNLVGDAPEDE